MRSHHPTTKSMSFSQTDMQRIIESTQNIIVIIVKYVKCATLLVHFMMSIISESVYMIVLDKKI